MKEVNNEMKEMKNGNATTNAQYAVTVSGLDATDGHRVPTEHPPAGQPTTDPPANDEDDDLGLDD